MGEGCRAEFVVDEDDGIARYSTTFVSRGVKTTVSLGSTTIKSDGVKSQFFWGSTTQEGECVDEYSYCVDTPYTDSAAASVSEDGGNNSDLVAQASGVMMMRASLRNVRSAYIFDRYWNRRRR